MHNTLILNFYVQFDTVLWSLFCFFPHTPFKGASNVANGLSCTLWWDWWKGLQLALCSSVLPTELSCSLTPGNRKPISAVEHNALLMYLSKCFMPVQKKKAVLSLICMHFRTAKKSVQAVFGDWFFNHFYNSFFRKAYEWSYYGPVFTWHFNQILKCKKQIMINKVSLHYALFRASNLQSWLLPSEL